MQMNTDKNIKYIICVDPFLSVVNIFLVKI